MSELVEIRGLTKVYEKKKTALDNLSLTIGRGRIIGLLGPNGSGKTTLIKLLCRLYEPDEGEILLGGVPISQYERSRRLIENDKWGILIQSPRYGKLLHFTAGNYLQPRNISCHHVSLKYAIGCRYFLVVISI